VLGDVAGDVVAAVQGRGEEDADSALLHQVARSVAHPGLETRVGGLAEAERVGEEVGGLYAVPHVELDVIDAEQRHLVVLRDRRRRGARARVLCGLHFHDSPPG
jgi:hypothetical protein